MNAILVQSDFAGPTLYYGPGAGMGPTASAVVADLMDVASGQCRTRPAATAPEYAAIEDIHSSYYLRIPANDRPGVFAHLATALSDLGISIEAVIQREHTRARGADAPVPIVLLTQPVAERTMRSAITALTGLDDVVADVHWIRVETLES